MKGVFWVIVALVLVSRVHGFNYNIQYVDMTLIQSAKAKGAVCLDGSLPGYNLARGFGSGSDNWVVFLEGGGWCDTLENCIDRTHSELGSSEFMYSTMPFQGILSNKPDQNPDFYNWNRVMIRYCDGGSFTGDVKEEESYMGQQIHFRGQRIWETAMEELMSQEGMRHAKQALLTGCSAGGLATILHCDQFAALFPHGTTVKCLSDAGLFVDAVDVQGGHSLRSFFDGVVSTHGSNQTLPRSCTSHMDATSCFFPQNVMPNIQTPLFVLNSAYDVWQIRHSVAPPSVDRQGLWTRCKDSIECDSNQIQFLQGFRNEMLNAVSGFSRSSRNGLFINSCFTHCQSELTETWYARDSPRIGDKGRIAERVGDWYFGRSKNNTAIDPAYPSNQIQMCPVIV